MRQIDFQHVAMNDLELAGVFRPLETLVQFGNHPRIEFYCHNLNK
jgi:hypothetical protein